MQAETTSFAPLGASALLSINGDSLVMIVSRLEEVSDCVQAVWSAIGGFSEYDQKSSSGIRIFLDTIGNGIDEVVNHLNAHLAARREGASA